MAEPGNVNPTKVQSAGMETASMGHDQVGSKGGFQGTPRTSSGTQHSSEVLHQRSKMPMCPARMAVGGIAVAALLGYFTLYTKKKPEATALDVAKVATGMATTQNTRPRN